MKTANNRKSSSKDDNKEEKIKSLEELIANAEKTITDARQMLMNLQGDSSFKAARPSYQPQPAEAPGGQIIHGNFDGQIMIGEDGKQYPVPANYASKSKLVEGDMLKLVITPEGNFVYKQIGPVERRYMIGRVVQDERGNFLISAEGKNYRVLLAAATYFKIEPGDEVTIVVPRDIESIWSAIENVVKKASEFGTMARPSANFYEPSRMSSDEDETEEGEEPGFDSSKPSAIKKLEKEIEEERKRRIQKESILDEWTPDIEALKREAGHPAGMEADEDTY